MLTTLIYDVLIILTAGLLSGVLCRRMGVSVLVGYLVVGALIGRRALGLVGDEQHEIEHIAEAGVLLLLFSIGLEFSLEELLGLGRKFFIGGGVQMLAVMAPTAALLLWLELPWQTAFLIASAVAFSSTVLVFKALAEWGQIGVPRGRRAIAILLFQDAALIPLLLVIPLLTGEGEAAGASVYVRLGVTTLLFIGSVIFARRLLALWLIPSLARYRSPDLIVLFTLIVLGGVTLAAYSVGLPPAVGAFAAGLIFSGNRWTEQVDALVLPFREAFAAIFFVGLGLIANPALLWREPVLLLGGLAAVVVLKAAAATLALRLTGLRWRSAAGMGIGLAHIGEFAFVLVLLGWETGVISDAHYQRLVTVALASLILSPLLLKYGLAWAQSGDEEREAEAAGRDRSQGGNQAVVIGMGPTGKQIASRLETSGHDVCVVDVSPLNLQTFQQQGFRAIAGDAAQPHLLEHARVEEASVVVVCVPNDDTALRIAEAVRRANPRGFLVIRCRYQSNVARIRRVGADSVVSEETKASEALLDVLGDRLFGERDT